MSDAAAPAPPPSIVATGSAMPLTVRTKDDPIFDWLRQHEPQGHDLFEGYDTRRVLAPGESIVPFAVSASDSALQSAELAPDQIDLVIGYISVGANQMPNDLYQVAKDLGVPSTAMIVPVNSEYANFNHGVVLADSLLRAGIATNALIVVGTNWSQYVDYHTPQSISAGDGAGAAVMTTAAGGGRYRLVGTMAESVPAGLGGMFMCGDPTTPMRVPPTFGPQYFHLTDKGIEEFKTFGMDGPPDLTKKLIARHGVGHEDLSFIAHQTSRLLLDKWNEMLAPAVFIDTLSTYANMTAASIPVNLDLCAAQITTPYLALAALGPVPDCMVVLLECLD